MSRGFRLFALCWLWMVLSLLPGCRRTQENIESSPAQSSAKSAEKKAPSPSIKAKFKSINLAYFNCVSVFGRAPASIQELAPILVSTTFPESIRKREEEYLQELKQGEIIVIWNQKAANNEKEGTTIVTAYEKKAPAEGGFVVYADGRVEWKTPAELADIVKDVASRESIKR